MRYAALFFITLSLCACGRFDQTFKRLTPADTTEVTFVQPRIQNERGEIMPQATLVGGLMIYAVDVNQPHRRGAKSLLDEFGQMSWLVPPATYVFYGVGYQAAGMSSASPMHCGATGPIALNGTPQTIQLVLDQNNCGNPPFSAPGMSNGNQPQQVYLAMCDSANATAITIASSCPAPSGWAPARAKMSLPEYNGFSGEIIIQNNAGSIFDSSCVAPTGGAPIASAAIVPTGSGPQDPFVIGINTYSGTSCTSYPNKRLYGLSRSIVNSGNPGFLRLEVDGMPFGGLALPPVVVGTNGTNIFIYLRDLL